MSYGSFYNYELETEKLTGKIIRLNPLFFRKQLSVELDIQARLETEGTTLFSWLGTGYRVSRWSKAPELWVTGSWLYSPKLFTISQLRQ